MESSPSKPRACAHRGEGLPGKREKERPSINPLFMTARNRASLVSNPTDPPVVSKRGREATMKEVNYFKIRAEYHSRLAWEAIDPETKAAHEAMAAELLAKAAKVDPNRQVVLVEGVAVDTDWPPAAA
jgi:hypothetical protein